MACRKCGGDHYNFVLCEEHAAEAAMQARRDRAPRMVLRAREDARDFGDRLLTVQAKGGTVFTPRKQHPLYQERAAAPELEPSDMTYPRFYDGDTA